jgi:hypothetical protein
MMKNNVNELQKAYLLSREYANKMKEPNSTKLMLIAQENLIQGFLDWSLSQNKFIVPIDITANKIMNWGSCELKNKITNLALKANFNDKR